MYTMPLCGLRRANSIILSDVMPNYLAQKYTERISTARRLRMLYSAPSQSSRTFVLKKALNGVNFFLFF